MHPTIRKRNLKIYRFLLEHDRIDYMCGGRKYKLYLAIDEEYNLTGWNPFSCDEHALEFNWSCSNKGGVGKFLMGMNDPVHTMSFPEDFKQIYPPLDNIEEKKIVKSKKWSNLIIE